MDYPVIQLDVDRSKAMQMGLKQKRRQHQHADLAERRARKIFLSYWVNWVNGVNYQVSVQTPQYAINSLDALLRHARRRDGRVHQFQ